MAYLPRVADGELVRALAATGAVLVEGAKACGKTATSERVATSITRVDTDPRVQAAVAVDPSLVLDGAPPQLLDEWQAHPELWNHVRRAVDDRGRPGQFILTGSSVPQDDVARHSGAGRFARLRMRPMSLFEAGHSTGAVSLAALLGGTAARAADTGMTVPRLAELVVVGGWPANQGRPLPEAARYVREYLDLTREVDLPRIGGPRRDPFRVGRLLASLARNVATEVAMTTLAADADAGDEGAALDRRTVAEYLDALERLMVVENQDAWAPHIRSKAALRTSPKRHLVDPSLAVAAVRAGPERLLADLNYLGMLFESLVVRDLRVLSGPLGGSVKHYRDASGLEVDAIVDLPDGRWAAFEVKLGSLGPVDAGASTLLRFAQTVDQTKVGPPAALVVVTATGFGYRRPDGVDVLPLSALAP